MGVSGQRHAPAALLPPGKGPPVPIVQPQSRSGLRLEEKSTAPTGDRTPIARSSNPLLRHYTDWANPAPHTIQYMGKMHLLIVTYTYH
jgi:hypothetical protein